MSAWTHRESVIERCYQYAADMVADLADVLTPEQIRELEGRWFTPPAEQAEALEAQAAAQMERLLFEAGYSADDAREAVRRARESVAESRDGAIRR